MTFGNTSPWSEQHVTDLTRLYAEGFSCRQIGEQIGFGRNAVIGKINRLGLPAPEKKKPIMRQGREQSAPNRTHLKRVYANGNRKSLRTIASIETEQYKLRCVEIVPRHLLLVDLEANDCRYPYGDGPFTFCGHPKKGGSSYCTPHFHLTFHAARVHVYKMVGRAA